MSITYNLMQHSIFLVHVSSPLTYTINQPVFDGDIRRKTPQSPSKAGGLRVEFSPRRLSFNAKYIVVRGQLVLVFQLVGPMAPASDACVLQTLGCTNARVMHHCRHGSVGDINNDQDLKHVQETLSDITTSALAGFGLNIKLRSVRL